MGFNSAFKGITEFVFSDTKNKWNGWQWQSSIKDCGISHIQWALL
jgi:hypothetical protein